jgi:hypothetical protein
MKTSEEKIYDLITNSAKRRFDYSSFENKFTTLSEELKDAPDNIIWMIIEHLSRKIEKKIIGLELMNQLLILGIGWDEKGIHEFVSDKEDLFRHEISATRLATSLLNAGENPKIVFNKITQQLI